MTQANDQVDESYITILNQLDKNSKMKGYGPRNEIINRDVRLSDNNSETYEDLTNVGQSNSQTVSVISGSLQNYDNRSTESGNRTWTISRKKKLCLLLVISLLCVCCITVGLMVTYFWKNLEQPVPKSAADVCVKKAGVCDEIEEFCDTNQNLFLGKSYREWNFPLRKLKADQMTLTSEILNVYCSSNRLCLHQQKLYCANSNAISVYNLDVQLMCNITFDISLYPRSIYPQSDRYFVVTGRRGLFRMTTSGQEVQKILIGSFIDVCVSKDVVAATKIHPSKVYILDRITLKLKRVFEVKKAKPHSILLVGHYIYVNFFSKSSSGVLTYWQNGTRVNNTLEGKHSRLSLCAWDSDQSILVASLYKFRLQVLDMQLQNLTWIEKRSRSYQRMYLMDAVMATKENHMYLFYKSMQSKPGNVIRKYYVQL